MEHNNKQINKTLEGFNSRLDDTKEWIDSH